MTTANALVAIIHQASALLAAMGSWLEQIPGSAIIARYVRNSYQNDPVRIILELFLVFFAIRYMVQTSYSINNKTVELTDKEVDELVNDWEPEPLVPALTAEKRRDLMATQVIVGANGPVVEVQGRGRLVNLASPDYMGLLGDEQLKEESVRVLREYGVGTCGPSGFYGTIDLHMQFEKDLAAFLGTEATILYAQGFSTIVSLIPAFSKRGDVIICDEGVSFGIQRGVQLSRSRVKYYRHNDMSDLERCMKEVDAEDRKYKRRLTRRFVVAEGLSQNFGDIVPLPELVRLKNQYKYRLILDESYSLGALGDHGRGVTEHFGVPASEVDMLAASLANGFCSSGGFCAGSIDIVDHQRLGATAYCFSASLPAILTKNNIQVLALAQNEPERFRRLRTNIQHFRTAFGESQHLQLVAAPTSPLIHLRLKEDINKRLSQAQADTLMHDIEEAMSHKGFLVRRALYVTVQERQLPPASLRLFITASLTPEQLQEAGRTLQTVSHQQTELALATIH